ncbi:hypothetical protein JX265_010513 [Neoarthrinium moseri]|uniref:Chromo domain-containing protein n=1 Tax=Neoarthrinium moseri TaxID=1658444 RepID=A0A9P9WDY3_9PEZI|nr:hypothetical protein JX265_010513 [Neoarthrinium moseri]
MSGLFQNIKEVFSPAPSRKFNPDPPAPADGNTGNLSDDSMPRGTKRKPDPYDVVDDDGAEESAVRTPLAQRLSRSRVSSEVPSGSKPRQSAGKIKRRSQSLAKRSTPRGGAPVVSPEKAPAETTRDDDDDETDSRASRAPVANMGGSELTKQGAESKDQEKLSEEKPTEQDAEKLLVKALDEGRSDGADGVHEVEKLLRHRCLSDGTVEFLVHWAGEKEEEATYEPEDAIQDGAAEMLYEYWKKLRGRSKQLFDKEKNREAYFVFKILDHKKEKSIMSMKVQWVGYPGTDEDTTWEPETKLKKIAKESLDKYWEAQGGREKYVGKRGRGKKAKIG